MTAPLNLDTLIPCPGCGGEWTWVENTDEEEGTFWSARCWYCGWECDHCSERPTWRQWEGEGAPLLSRLIAEIDRLNAELESQQPIPVTP